MIVPMKRLTLVGLEADEGRMLAALQAISAVQIISAEETSADDALLARLEGQVQRLDNAQALVRPFAPKAGLGPKPEYKAAELYEGLSGAMALCGEIESLEHELSQTRSEAEKRAATIAALAPWLGMTDKMQSVRSSASTRALMGMLPADALPAAMELPAAVQSFGGEKEKAVLAVFHESDSAEVSQALRNLGLQEYNFPALNGTPAEATATLTAEMETLRSREAELSAKLASYGEKRAELCCALDAACMQRDLEAGKSRLGATARTFVLDGWVRSDEIEGIRAALDGVTDAYYADFQDPAEGEPVPTVLKNSKLIEPYEAVTNLYSLPAADGVDTTPLMAPFYFIFFGMMLSDTAYGIVLALGAFLFLRLIKPTGMMKNLAGVLMQGGISTIFMGVLFGTFAGVGWPTILAGTALQNAFPLIDSSTEPIAMLAVCAGFGIIHMFYGVFIAVSRCIKKGDWMGAIVDNLAWVFIITGLLLLAAPALGLPPVLAVIGKWLAIGFAALVFLFAGRANKKILGRMASGAGKLYDVTAWLGDVLSYARIFALGLSTGVIGLVLNTLCWDMLFSSFKGNPLLMIVGFIIVTALSLALHLFMMAISTLGCFVHTARLQYVEFFGKFYEAGGKAFKPLGYKTRHVRIAEK